MSRMPSPASRAPRTWSTFVPVVAALAGLLFATSFKTAQGTEIRSSGRDLPALIRAENHDVATSAERVRQLQSEVDHLSAAAAPGDSRVQDLTGQAAALAAGAGTQSVHGPSLTVSLDDAHRTAASLPKPYGPDDIVVHQQDVQGVVNALWAGGAEAMMIQDQRVISTSAVRCVGNTLLLQGRVYSPPYVITAIGDPEQLRKSLQADPQVEIYREWVSAVGVIYEESSDADRTFPAYAGPVTPQVATVAR
ncbi:DUF881 domain-containing protein [Lapillicoccus sp.]|uniref:DUF881 domain-containing protein n=1 Tax=Lapillicoccus sp. TaxID=1909287 RepID=UPI0039832CF2